MSCCKGEHDRNMLVTITRFLKDELFIVAFVTATAEGQSNRAFPKPLLVGYLIVGWSLSCSLNSFAGELLPYLDHH